MTQEDAKLLKRLSPSQRRILFIIGHGGTWRPRTNRLGQPGQKLVKLRLAKMKFVNQSDYEFTATGKGMRLIKEYRESAERMGAMG